MICDFCEGEINPSKCITRESLLSFGTSECDINSVVVHSYCCVECAAANDILTHIDLYGSLSLAVGHLIDHHGYTIDVLERTLNKRLFDGSRFYDRVVD